MTFVPKSNSSLVLLHQMHMLAVEGMTTAGGSILLVIIVIVVVVVVLIDIRLFTNCLLPGITT